MTEPYVIRRKDKVAHAIRDAWGWAVVTRQYGSITTIQRYDVTVSVTEAEARAAAEKHVSRIQRRRTAPPPTPTELL